MGKIFAPSKRITGVSSSVSTPVGGAGGGISWNPRESFILEFMEKSKEKIIFVENAHELKKVEFETIFEATRRNNRLRFILEIATPYKCDVQLRGGSYEVVKLKELSNEDIEKILIRECPNFSDVIVKRIVSLSKGYPYVARSLAYICDNKKEEKVIFEFLRTLRDDDMKYNLDRIHKDVLNTLKEDSQGVIMSLAIAPAILTLNLIEAFCGEKVDIPLNVINERGILVKSEEKFYQIYHPLFREYLRNIQPIALKDKKEIYCEAMEGVKSELDSIYILFEVLNEPDIFGELIKQTENYEAINSVGIQTHTWGKLEQALCAWDHLLEKTKGVDKEWESIATGNIGIVYAAKRELDKALEYFKKALDLDGELGRQEGVAADLGNIGIVYYFKGELDKALEYCGKALKLDEELGSKEGMAANYGNIGIVYAAKGELDKALEYYEKALKLDEELGSKEGMAANYGNVGVVYKNKGELEKALKYCEKALRLHEELKNKEGMANQLGNIGNIYFTKGEFDKALEYYEKALKMYEELGMKEGVAADLGSIGNVYTTKGELDKALGYYEKALKVYEELGKKEGIAADYANIGVVYRIKGELEKALECQEEALKIFKERGNRIETAQTLANIGEVFIQKGNKEQALDYYHEAQSLAKGSYVFEDVSKRLKRLEEE
jgi:tetratricopeptide (TPR) repeat protein